MKPEKIDFILNSAKNGNNIDLYDNSIRPIVAYLRDDIKAIKLFDEKILLTEFGYEILKLNGWNNYQKYKRKKPLTTYQYIYLPLFTLFGVFGIYKYYSDKHLKLELDTVNMKLDSIKLENRNLILQVDSLTKWKLEHKKLNKSNSTQTKNLKKNKE